MKTDFTIGIDLSKANLDAYSLPDGIEARFDNSNAGFEALMQWLGKKNIARIVYEATGAYHRKMEVALHKAGFNLCKVNPLRAKQFSKAIGNLAKTDKCDAIMLAKFGVTINPPIREPRPQYIEEIRELWIAHEALNKTRTAVLNRNHNTVSKLLLEQNKAQILLFETQLDEIKTTMISSIKSDDALNQKYEILLSIPGIGSTTALGLIATMPELGAIDNKAAAALAGLAPITRQSGKWQGKSFISGGRACVRTILYLPALVATRFNQDLKAKYQSLIKANKPPKLAITAIMRKLLILANSLLRKNQSWIHKPS